MRQKNETATSFNQLKEITQAIQAQKRSAQTSDNANTREIAGQSTQTPKTRAQAKKHALKPTKKAFSERQITAFRDNSQASDEKRTEQDNQQGDNANAFKSDESNTRGQQ
ncbi:hypothetical protein ACLGBA_01760 [Helicobacter pylori]|uniref:hypothetical protein n=1 Tax=Helicobacter pylori TaxID=210 RepID=UPI001EDA996F|nr:hypothetical protein [Helicobacter pylori]MCG3068532.1 hypothetical protein [Helicobacter pylori]